MVNISCCFVILQIICITNGQQVNSNEDSLTQLQLQQKEANKRLRGSEEKMLNLPKNDIVKNENNISKNENEETIIVNNNDIVPISRTATGGFVNTILVFLTVFAFLGNGAFMVYVFWLSKSS
mmetsp:Transcript_34141/g.32566  ORF Transcript_34141/g.32566 Transcript_34141/m.32566 type:complete len:123 (+) Transcript_34141:245-613(+)